MHFFVCVQRFLGSYQKIEWRERKDKYCDYAYVLCKVEGFTSLDNSQP